MAFHSVSYSPPPIQWRDPRRSMSPPRIASPPLSSLSSPNSSFSSQPQHYTPMHHPHLWQGRRSVQHGYSPGGRYIKPKPRPNITPDVNSAVSTPPGLVAKPREDIVPPTAPVFNNNGYTPSPQHPSPHHPSPHHPSPHHPSPHPADYEASMQIISSARRRRPPPLEAVEPEMRMPTQAPGEATIMIAKQPGEALGMGLDEMVLTSVRPGSPAEKQGAGSFLGKKLTHINNAEVHNNDDIRATTPSPKSNVALTFRPVEEEPQPLSPVDAQHVEQPQQHDTQPVPEPAPEPLPVSPKGSPYFLDPKTAVVAPPLSPASPEHLDPFVDPRNNLPYQEIPPKYASAFKDLVEGKAVVYFVEELGKVNRSGKIDERVLLVLDNAVYLCKGSGELTRTLKILDFTELVLGPDNRLGMRVRDNCKPVQHDMLLQLRNEEARDKLVKIVQSLHDWWGPAVPIAVTVGSSQLTNTTFKLRKDSKWKRDEQVPLPFTGQTTVMSSARRSVSPSSRRR